MEWYSALGLMLGLLLGLMAIGMPVAFAFLITNFICAFIFIGASLSSFLQVVDNSTALITRFTLMPVPLFILMGTLFFESGLATRVFDAFDKLLGRLPGRLCYLTVLGGTIFSTLTGSSMANCAMLGSLMVPEMSKRGYNWRMSLGPILGTGGLAIIIPPSNLGVLLASLSGISVGGLLIAGLIPGLVLSFLFCVLIFLQLWINPAGAPAYDVARWGIREKISAVVTNVLPMSLVIFMVIGLIILGITTPTEAAAFGVLGVLILAIAFRLLTWRVIEASFMATVKITGVVFFIIVNSSVFSQLLSFSGVSSGLLAWVASFQLPALGLMLIMLSVVLFLGMFVDPVSIMLITIPIFFPLLSILHVDPMWFAICMLVALEMSQTTPPFGLLLFVMLGLAPKGTTLFRVANAAFPFLICDTIVIGLILLFPPLALYLPSLM